MKLHSVQTLLLLLTIASFTNQWCEASEKAVLRRRIKGTKAPKSKKAHKKSAERAITMWWVLFNKPSECAANPGEDVQCGISDVMKVGGGDPNNAEIVIMHASGGITNKDGSLQMVTALYKTCTEDLNLVADTEGALAGHYTWGGPENLFNATTGSTGYCPADGETTEVHIVLRDHGPVVAENKLWQITRFKDPSCSQNGGPNLCSDVGAVGFSPMAADGSMTKDIFPAGCAETGECEANVEAIQLTAGMGNEVTLIKSGDVLQVVAEITVPKRDGEDSTVCSGV